MPGSDSRKISRLKNASLTSSQPGDVTTATTRTPKKTTVDTTRDRDRAAAGAAARQAADDLRAAVFAQGAVTSGSVQCPQSHFDSYRFSRPVGPHRRQHLVDAGVE